MTPAEVEANSVPAVEQKVAEIVQQEQPVEDHVGERSRRVAALANGGLYTGRMVANGGFDVPVDYEDRHARKGGMVSDAEAMRMAVENGDPDF